MPADERERSAPPPRPRKRPRSPRQIEKDSETRARILQAAGKVVGEHGYAGASIAGITAEAAVAHGAFYLHFRSRQALFDALLPELGQDMLETISTAVRESRSLEEIERRGLTANFHYLSRHPELDRIMNEAELFAPEAFACYVGMIQERYIRSLIRSRDRGDMRDFTDAQIETIAALLTGARSYLLRLYARKGGGMRPLDEAQVEIYLDVFLNGIASDRHRTNIGNTGRE